MTKARKWVICLSAAYCLSIANYVWPVIRLSVPLLNYSFAILVLLIPLLLFVIAPMAIERRWLQVTAILGILPLALISFVLSFLVYAMWLHILKTGVDSSFEPIHYVQLQHSRVAIYRTDIGGAVGDFGIVGRQEMCVFPGILLVRKIYRVSPGYDAELTVLDSQTIRIVSPPYFNPTKRPQPDEAAVKLRPWVYL